MIAPRPSAAPTPAAAQAAAPVAEALPPRHKLPPRPTARAVDVYEMLDFLFAHLDAARIAYGNAAVRADQLAARLSTAQAALAKLSDRVAVLERDREAVATLPGRTRAPSSGRSPDDIPF